MRWIDLRYSKRLKILLIITLILLGLCPQVGLKTASAADPAIPVKAVQVAAGGLHSLALKSDGSVVAWGSDNFGQRKVPDDLFGVVAIAAGKFSSLALKSDGTVVAWGRSFSGQEEVIEGLSGVVSIAAGDYHSLALKSDGTVVGWGDNTSGETTAPDGLSGVVAVAAGNGHSLALKSDGTVVAWGRNDILQAKVPIELTSGVISIAAGGFHSMALKSDGTVISWGDNYNGVTTVPDDLSGVEAIVTKFAHSLALKSDGTVVGWGINVFGKEVVQDGLTGVVAIAAGDHHSLALKSDGTVVAWGYNIIGQTIVPGNDTLSGLTMQEGSFDPEFSSLVTDYTYAYIGSSVTDVHITATVTDATYSDLYINNILQSSGSTATVSVSGATTAIPVRVEPYFKSGRTYTIIVHADLMDPDVQFNLNGNVSPSTSVQSTVTATDTESGIDIASLQYVWTQSTAVPSSDWTAFTSGDTLEQTSGDGNWYLHVRAEDLAGNVTDAVSNAFVLDNTAPVIALNGSNPMNIPQGGSYTEPGAVITDTIDGSIPSSSMVITGTVDPSQLGTYLVQYGVTDQTGNTATVTRSVYVYDGNAPSIYLNGTNPMTIELNSLFTDPGATAQDLQDGDITSSIIVTGTVDTHTVGTYTLNYDVSDSAGNAASTVTRLVKVSQRTSSSTDTSDIPKPVINNNGVKLDPSLIDTTKPSVTLELKPNNAGTAFVSIPASVLTDFADNNSTFLIEIKTPYGSYQVPVSLASLIPGLGDFLAEGNFKAEDISFKITLTDKTSDKDIQAAFTNSLPKGKIMGAIVDFHMDIINTKTEQTIVTGDTFNQALTRLIPMPKNMTSIPEQWGAFRYNETTEKFEFVPAQAVKIDDVWVVVISSYSNSVYVVTHNEVSFTDVRKHWGQSYVQLAGAKGIVDGVGGGYFAPDRPVTRAEFAAMLVRALGRGTTAGSTTSYDDVKQGAWYYDEIIKAKELGLLNFVKGSSFKPNQPLTREEMASMLAATITLEEMQIPKENASLNDYKDIGSEETAYLEDIRLMIQLSIMIGTSEDTFSPKDETTRAQAAVVFIRMLQTLEMID